MHVRLVTRATIFVVAGFVSFSADRFGEAATARRNAAA
jgi:hypothetical protein